MAFETQTAAAAGVAEAAGGATYAGSGAKGGEALPPETGVPFVTNEDTSLIITADEILAAYPDIADDFSVVNVNVNCGAVYANPDGTWTFVPYRDFYGEGSLFFVLSNGTTTVNGTATIDVLPVNDAPVLNLPGLDGDEAVNSHTLDSQDDSSLARLADGGYIVTWASQYQDGSGWGVYAQRYDAAGGRIGEEFRVNAETDNDQRVPHVSALADGGFVVTWQSTGDGFMNGIYQRRFDAGANPVGSESLVNETVAGSQEDAQVAGVAGGGHVVVWDTRSGDGRGLDIHLRAYDAAGRPVSGEVLVTEVTVDKYNLPSIAALAGGDVIVSWTTEGRDGDGNGVFARRYDASGNAVGPEFQVNSYTVGMQEAPAIAGTEDGGFVIAWQSYQQDGSQYGVYLQRYDAAGQPVGGEVAVNGHTAGNQLEPAVAGLEGGGYVVIWQSQFQDGSGRGVYGQIFDAKGDAVGGEFRVNVETQHDQQRADVEGLPGGGFVVTWTSYGQDGDRGGIYQRVFDADGTPTPDPRVFIENGDPVVVSESLQVADVDSQTLVGATVTIEGVVSAEDVLSFTARAGIAGSYNAATGVLTLSGEASLADYQAVLRSVAYQNTGDNPTGNGAGTSRTITFQVDDGASENNVSEAVSVTVAVVPENDAPEVSAPVDLVLSELSGLVIRTEDLLANASDPEGDALSVLNLSVDHGTLTDNGDGTWTYVPGEGFTNEAVLSYQISDGELVADATATIHRPASGGSEFPQPGGEDRFVFAADAGGDANGDAEGASGDDAFADGSAGSDFAEAAGLDTGDTLLVDDGASSFGSEPPTFGQDDFRFV